MKNIRRIAGILLALALVSPYTVFAENDTADVEIIEAGTMRLLGDEAAREAVAPLTPEEKEFLEYVVSEYINQAETITIPDKFSITSERLNQLYENYIGALIQYEHPELFYAYGGIAIEKTDSNIVMSITPHYTMTAAQIQRANEMIDEEIQRATERITSGMTDFEKVLVVHDYIANNYDYDERLYESKDEENRTLDGMVRDKHGVCQGYSHLFMIIMQHLGIECETVPTTELAHMWNKVKIDGQWYNIDLTVDDPRLIDKSLIRSMAQYHSCFLISDEHIKEIQPSLHATWNSTKWDGQTPVPVSAAEDCPYTVWTTGMFGPFVSADGKFYFTGEDENEKKIIAFLNYHAQGDDEASGTVYTLENNETWSITDTDGNTFISLPAFNLIDYNGDIYINTANKVYKLDTQNYTNHTVVYDLEADKTKPYGAANFCLGGLAVKNGVLYAEYLTSPISTEEDNEGYFDILKAKPDEYIKIAGEEPPAGTCSVALTAAEEEGKVTVVLDIPDDMVYGSTVHIAEYDENNAFIGFSESRETRMTHTFMPRPEASQIKAFIWSRENELTPLAQSAVYTVPEHTTEPDRQ